MLLPTVSMPPALRVLGVRSSLAVLIDGKDQPFGVLDVHSTEPNRFTPQDVHFVQSSANVLADAIERHVADEALRYRVLHDPLTGLPNRLSFIDSLSDALKRSTASGSPGNSGHTSRTLSHRVMTQSKRSSANSLRCFDSCALRSMPCSSATRARAWLTAYASAVPPVMPVMSSGARRRLPRKVVPTSTSAIEIALLFPAEKTRLVSWLIV